MKNLFKFLTPLLIVLFMMLTVSEFYGQKLTPSGSGYVPVNNTKVYYEVYGEGKPIVLLHGAFMTIDMNWGQLIPELSKPRKVIALELQGHGHTPFSDRKLAHTTLAGDVAKVMDYLKIEKADVLGYSFGGAVAYQFAIQSPERVNKLVIISATYKSTGWLPEVRNAFKAMKPDLFMNSPMQEAYNAVAPDKTKWTKFLEQMIASAGQPFDLGDSNISKIYAPVLIISGDNDGLDKTELAKTYTLLGGGVSADMAPMPKSQLAIVPGQGHVSLMMQTATILSYLNGFLK
ncbi:pimeloyl-ACP methyl ester carboxylesterase [Chryseobacterium rhizosphaerae]|uniref:Pimeloyl-ACP methyl ester carboxylesterase n=1 Tax=Chryseobacterium rhizosphaerae TaxID=395937 RepID=A0AAE3Y8H8_9FLAO|nr:alpha/beta hydrolase [Chryseobacterium rhizosphaerae]MDR6525576.1 pimeloyl-ACP methyl ester carboxylesterase [Chryseobacterium rhizosphaerae]